MKNLFSPYKFNSVKQFIFNRALILGLLLIILIFALLLNNYNNNLEIDLLVNHVKNICAGKATYSEEQLKLMSPNNSFSNFFLWGSLFVLLSALAFFASQMVSYFLNSLNRIKQFSTLLKVVIFQNVLHR